MTKTLQNELVFHTPAAPVPLSPRSIQKFTRFWSVLILNARSSVCEAVTAFTEDVRLGHVVRPHLIHEGGCKLSFINQPYAYFKFQC
jgi:hypothetical protein